MATKKRTVKKSSQASKPQSVAEVIDVTKQLPPPPVEEDVQPGIRQMTVPAEGKINRLLNKLVMAENEAAEMGAIADQLSTENEALQKQNRQLTESVRALETALYAKEHQNAESDSEPAED